MAWTTPRTWNTGDSLDAAALNLQLRDNMEALYRRSRQILTIRDAVANVTMSAQTSGVFAEVDDDQFSLELSYSGEADLMFFINLTINKTANASDSIFDIIVDDDKYVSSAASTPLTFGIWRYSHLASYYETSSKFFIMDASDLSLESGNHTFRLRHSQESGGTGTINLVDHIAQFGVMEV